MVRMHTWQTCWLSGLPSNLDLIDLTITNKAYTWSNGRPTPTLERLDRALISRDWLSIFPRSSLRALPRPRTDHSPLVLSASSFIPAPHLFRFETFWLRYPKVADVITVSWSATSETDNRGSSFASKILGVTMALKDWSAGKSSSLKLQANLCLFWMSWIDSAEELKPLTWREGVLRPKLKARFEKLCLQEELF